MEYVLQMTFIIFCGVILKLQETLEEECKTYRVNIADLEKALENAHKVSTVGLSNARNSSVIFQIPSNFFLPDRNGKPLLIQQIKQRIR